MVARLAKGATLVRYLGETSGRVTLALGRNKQAKLPPDRVLLTTGLVGLSDDEIEAFRRECEAISSDIELSDVWEVVRDEATSWNLGALAELRWGASTDIAHLVAMALRLDADHDYFVYGKDGYTPRTEEDVDDIRVRRKREAERAEAAASLMSHLTQGTLPHPLPASQAPLLEHLRAYAIHGDDYARSPTAKGLLGTAGDATGDPQRRSFELLVAAGVFGADEPLELHRAGIVADLPEDAVSEAAAIHLSNVEAFSKRTDLTAFPTITIDDPATLDRDDAISFERLEDAADVDGSSYRVGVHIADAAAIIPLGGAIDREADRRMSTLYLPERTIGMLPAQVSHELGSLEAGETRAAISVLVRFSHLDEVTDWDVVPSVVRSDGSLSYEDADQAVADKSGRWHSMLHRLHQAAQSLRSRRESAGAVNLDRAEMTIMVRSAGAVEVKVVQRSTAARELVTELMILCNSLLADFARRNQLPAVFRSQGPPDLADMPSDIRKGDGPAGDTLWRHPPHEAPAACPDRYGPVRPQWAGSAGLSTGLLTPEAISRPRDPTADQLFPQRGSAGLLRRGNRVHRQSGRSAAPGAGASGRGKKAVLVPQVSPAVSAGTGPCRESGGPIHRFRPRERLPAHGSPGAGGVPIPSKG